MNQYINSILLTTEQKDVEVEKASLKDTKNVIEDLALLACHNQIDILAIWSSIYFSSLEERPIFIGVLSKRMQIQQEIYYLMGLYHHEKEKIEGILGFQYFKKDQSLEEVKKILLVEEHLPYQDNEDLATYKKKENDLMVSVRILTRSFLGEYLTIVKKAQETKAEGQPLLLDLQDMIQQFAKEKEERERKSSNELFLSEAKKAKELDQELRSRELEEFLKEESERFDLK
jgi:hypothetical protein